MDRVRFRDSATTASGTLAAMRSQTSAVSTAVGTGWAKVLKEGNGPYVAQPPRQLLDARTGHQVGAIELPRGLAIYLQWEGENHLLGVVRQGHHVAIVRVSRNGHLSRTTPLRRDDNVGYPSVILATSP